MVLWPAVSVKASCWGGPSASDRCGWKHFLLLWVLFGENEWMMLSTLKHAEPFSFGDHCWDRQCCGLNSIFPLKHIASHAWILRVSLSAFYSGNSLQSFYFIYRRSSVELKHYFFPVSSPVKAGLESGLSILNGLEITFSECLENGSWYRPWTPDPAFILPKSLEWAAEPGLTVVLFLIH